MKQFFISEIAACIITVLLINSGCSDLTSALEQSEKKQIEEYIRNLGDTIYELKPSGLYLIELIPGTGALPDDNDTVSFWFRGALLDNTTFTSNNSESSPYKYILGTGLKTGEIIKGLDEGLRYIKQGGTSRLVLPSRLAFGVYGLGMAIPGYTPVYYEIRLVSVKPGP